jgi:CRP/FNR family transcriptional regulator, cyclic AMP receptor protein
LLVRRRSSPRSAYRPALAAQPLDLLDDGLRCRLPQPTVVAAGSFLSLKGRVARTMLELADHFGQEVAPGRIVIRQKIGQNDLAAMTGIARENLTRVLNDWQRHKVLSRASGYYCLEDKAQLEHQAEL